MADHLDRLHTLSDVAVPPLLTAQAVRARGDQRRRRRTAALGATAVLVAALGGGVALAAGQAQPDALRFATPPSSSPATGPTPTTEPTPAAEPTPSAEPTPATDETPEPTSPPSEEPSPSATPPQATPSPVTPPAAPAAPVFPEEAAVEHGGRSTAVYLAVAYDGSDPELARAYAQAREVGYSGVGIGDVACDQGAGEALGLDPARAYSRVAVYFPDRATAQQFVDAYEPGVVGIADVTTYCLD